MNNTRTGKIARLPHEIKEQLNRRLQNGEPGKQLVAWLNGLPEVQAVVAAEFGGKPIREQNLSEWKQRGYREWEAKLEALEVARQMAADAGELQQAGGPLTDKMAVWLAARYVVAARKLANCEPNGEPDWKRLRELCNDLVALRRGDHCAEQLRLERERLAKANEKDDDRALGLLAEEIEKWPELRQAYDHLAVLYRQRKAGQPAAGATRSDQTESNQNKPNQTP